MPEGTGKTFLHKALLHYFSGIGKKVLPMAWAGITSIFLPKEVTSHKTFKLPFDLSSTETSVLKSLKKVKRFRCYCLGRSIDDTKKGVRNR